MLTLTTHSRHPLDPEPEPHPDPDPDSNLSLHLHPTQAGEHGQHCRFCGFESDGVKYPPCPSSSAKGSSAKGKAASTLATSFLLETTTAVSSTLSATPTRPVLPMVLVGVGLVATVFAAGIAVGARRGGATSGLLANEAAGSWAPVAVKLSAEGDYDRFAK